MRGPSRRVVARALLGGVLTSLTACGGVIQFSDSTPIVLASPAPPPEPAPEPRVEVKQDRIEIHEKIQFEIDKAEILPVSHGLLNEVVGAIKAHPEIRKVDINGHTDSDGDDKYNQGLSERRAKAVRQYLVQNGVEEGRLSARGFGESRPIADNGTPQGREQNRRVEFLIVEQEGVP